MNTYYITTAIDYTNAAPHIGHAYEKILTDVFARYHRLKGEPVFFLTGVDQHGQKVQQSAEKAGVPPAEFAREVTAKFLALWEKLSISYDGWAATTDPRHTQCVKEILRQLYDRGLIYKANYGGYYSVRQEQFLTDKERGETGEFGPEWGEVIFLEEENYYFKLAEHREWLARFLASNRDHVSPDFRQAELDNAMDRLSGDLCISRPKERLSWGIELPFDSAYVTYVWFDALINYISFAGYLAEPGSGLPDFNQLWPPAAHVIGKDILVPAHGIYWPIMLHALGFPDHKIPRLLVHGYINMGGAKMSKTLGNVVDPDALADKYGAEALRYYLMRDAVTGQDMDFSEDRLEHRYNADLANDLGNLLNRVLNMAHRYRNGILNSSEEREIPNVDAALQPVTVHRAVCDAYLESMNTFAIHSALEAVWRLVSCCNSFVEITAPWKLAKDESQARRLDAVLYQLAESLRLIALMVAPVMPAACARILEQLQVGGSARFDALIWGGIAKGHQLGRPIPLFPRTEVAAAGR